ncbi:hypothetical protein GCM10020331_041760 [Ectobacillus funiculus]
MTLVDTGTNTAEARLALQAGLGELGYRLSDIETVIITHHHVDHSGLLNDFFRRPLLLLGIRGMSRGLVKIQTFFSML